MIINTYKLYNTLVKKANVANSNGNTAPIASKGVITSKPSTSPNPFGRNPFNLNDKELKELSEGLKRWKQKVNQQNGLVDVWKKKFEEIHNKQWDEYDRMRKNNPEILKNREKLKEWSKPWDDQKEKLWNDHLQQRQRIWNPAQ